MKTTLHRPPSAPRSRHVFKVLAIAALLGPSIPAASAADSTLAEMLELGIYSEETKGDLDAAIALYGQIVAEDDASEAVAAQAQFRLAMCEHKQGDFAAATAAFEKLVRDYGTQSELVALANEYLASGSTLQPAPWVHGEEMQYAIRLHAGTRIGLARRSVFADTRDGRKIWRFQAQALAGGGQEWSRVEVDATTSKPIHCQWKVNVMGDADIVYTATGAETTLRGNSDVKHATFSGPVYDNEQAAQLMRQMPLAVGFETILKVHSGLSGGLVIDLPLRVAETASVTVPAGTFDCFKVTLKVFASEQVFWYSNDAHRYLVKLEANGAVLELTRVVNVADAEPITYHDETFGFSLTAPSGWMIDRLNPGEPQESNLLVFDPTGMAMAKVSVESTTRFDPKVSASAQTFYDYKLEQVRKHVQRLELAPDAQGEFLLDGQPAVTLVAEFVQAPMPTPRKFFGVYGLSHGNTVEVWCATAPEDFEAFRPGFEKVVATYRGK